MEIEITKEFEGYIWWSNSPYPDEFNNNKELVLNLNDGENPFIIEAQLTNKVKSYSVKCIDGKYKVAEYDLNKVDFAHAKQYLSNRMENKTLFFCQRWAEGEADEMCGNVKVLTPSALVFVGFNNNEK